MRSPAMSAAKCSDELPLLRDVQVDSEQEQRPENDGEHCGRDQPDRVQMLEVVVRRGDRDADDQVDDAQEARSEHARGGYPDSGAPKLEELVLSAEDRRNGVVGE